MSFTFHFVLVCSLFSTFVAFRNPCLRDFFPRKKIPEKQKTYLTSWKNPTKILPGASPPPKYKTVGPWIYDGFSRRLPLPFLFGMVYFSRGPALKIPRGVVVNEFNLELSNSTCIASGCKSHPSKPEKIEMCPTTPPPTRRLRINTWKRIQMIFRFPFGGRKSLRNL